MKSSPSPRLAPPVCWLALAALAVGCQTPVPEVQRPSVKKDPCAERLHDICGKLLLHYSIHNKLPQSLQELEAPGSKDPSQWVCPVSGKPYIYNPDGLRVAGRLGRVVLHDAIACHSGMCWAILVDDPGGGKPLTARVILLAEESVSSAGE